MTKDKDTHCEEAQEIMGKMPSWTIRWGATAIFAIFVMIVIGCCIIKFPEKIVATISLTTGNAPVDIVARTGGEILQIYVGGNDIVHKGDIIAVIKSSADSRGVMAIGDSLAASAKTPIDILVRKKWIYAPRDMGNLQTEHSSFIQACRKYDDYLERDVTARKKLLITEQISKQQEYYSQMTRQTAILRQRLALEQEEFQRDSTLQANNVIADAELNASAMQLLQTKNDLMASEAQMTNIEMSTIQLRQQLIELSLQQDDDRAALEQDIMAAMERLNARVEEWKLNYLLVSPMDGRASFTRKWDKSQFINAGETFVTIIPQHQSQPIGVLKVPQSSFGKVETDQKVNVKLDGYPYMEYGMLVGRVSYISSVPEIPANANNASTYTVEVVFDDGMRTTYGKDIRLIQKMDGTAEIITADRRLIMRILDPIKALFENGI